MWYEDSDIITTYYQVLARVHKLCSGSYTITCSFVSVYCSYSVSTGNILVWSVWHYIKEIVYNWLFVNVMCGRWHYVSRIVSFDNMQDWEVIQEKVGEAYITNDETSRWILSRCGTDIYFIFLPVMWWSVGWCGAVCSYIAEHGFCSGESYGK